MKEYSTLNRVLFSAVHNKEHNIMNRSSLLKAQSPAALAEEYIVKSIWNNVFPAGSELPSERDLADRIGVTRTTLREVLQRLARDGWLTIQHGKATRVNDVWKTAGPRIIDTIIQLDPSMTPTIIDNVVTLRTKMAEYYIPIAIKLNAEKCVALFQDLTKLEDTAEDYVAFDYALFRGFTFIANKPVYALILNSFKEMYYHCAELFFKHKQARIDALLFYRELLLACEKKDYQRAAHCMVEHRQQSMKLWLEILQHLAEEHRE